ncbi:MAG: DUF2442 domain-containing protein [Caulobacteraceae bacterium]
MAEFKTIDAAAFRKAGERGRIAYSTPRATAAWFDRRTGRIVITLDTGIDFAFDPRRAPGLAEASPEDLAGVSVEGVGSTVHFPRLDADFTVSRLLEGFLGPLDWTRREARAMASRQNGRLGGRPRKAAIRSDAKTVKHG